VTPGIIRIKNWKRFQHYQHRNPPWIKLYRELLDPAKAPWYRGLSDNAARWLIELWLLASAHAGTVPYDSLMILRDTARTTADKPLLDSALGELASAGAIAVDGADASAEFLATLAHRGTEIQRSRETDRQRDRESVQQPIELDYAMRCTIAANQALGDLLAGAYRPLVADVERPAAVAWEVAGIPIELAARVIGERVAAFRSTAHNRQPHTLRYFDGAIREAHARAQGQSAPSIALTPGERMEQHIKQEAGR